MQIKADLDGFDYFCAIINSQQMNKSISILSGILLFLTACTGTSPKAIQEDRLTDFVDPFIGTGYHGHTYPGAAYPFGQIQLGPDNGAQGWDWC